MEVRFTRDTGAARCEGQGARARLAIGTKARSQLRAVRLRHREPRAAGSLSDVPSRCSLERAVGAAHATRGWPRAVHRLTRSHSYVSRPHRQACTLGRGCRDGVAERSAQHRELAARGGDNPPIELQEHASALSESACRNGDRAAAGPDVGDTRGSSGQACTGRCDQLLARSARCHHSPGCGRQRQPVERDCAHTSSVSRRVALLTWACPHAASLARGRGSRVRTLRILSPSFPLGVSTSTTAPAP